MLMETQHQMRRLILISHLWIQYSDNASLEQQSSRVLKGKTQSTENWTQMKTTLLPLPLLFLFQSSAQPFQTVILMCWQWLVVKLCLRINSFHHESKCIQFIFSHLILQKVLLKDILLKVRHAVACLAYGTRYKTVVVEPTSLQSQVFWSQLTFLKLQFVGDLVQ